MRESLHSLTSGCILADMAWLYRFLLVMSSQRPVSKHTAIICLFVSEATFSCIDPQVRFLLSARFKTGNIIHFLFFFVTYKVMHWNTFNVIEDLSTFKFKKKKKSRKWHLQSPHHLYCIKSNITTRYNNV